MAARDTETERIAQQLAQGFDGGAWHGPSLAEILAGVDFENASMRSKANCHTIAEIVAHLLATQRVILRRIDGDATAINLPESDEWPAPASDAVAWRAAIDELRRNDRTIRERIAVLPDDRLDAPLIPGGTSAYNNFHGYLQHNLYHAGQIMLLKKAFESQPHA